MSNNDPKAIEGPKRYSMAEIARQNGVTAQPMASQKPPIREATARRVPRSDPPPTTAKPAPAIQPGWQKPASATVPSNTTAPKGRPTPSQAKPSSTVTQTASKKRSPISWTPIIVALLVIAGALGGIALWKSVGVGPAVSVALPNGEVIEGEQVGSNAGPRTAPIVTGECKFNAYDALPGSNEFGPKPDPMPTSGAEGRDQQAVVFANDCQYASVQYVLNVLNEPLTWENFSRVKKLVHEKTELFRVDKTAWQQAVDQWYAQADQFILMAAPNEHYWSFGFIPGANRSIQPQLTQLGERQDLSLALVVLKKDGTLLDKYRVPCQYQNVMEMELPKVTPPTPVTPDSPDTPDNPPPDNPPPFCEQFPDAPECNPEPPPFCEQFPDAPECNPEPPPFCEQFPDAPECNPCPPGECKSPNPDDYPHEADPPVGVIDTPPAPPVVIPNPAGDRPVPAPSGPSVQAPEVEAPPAQYDPQAPPIEQSEPEESANDTDQEPGGDTTVG